MFDIISARLDGTQVQVLHSHTAHELTHPRVHPAGGHLIFTESHNGSEDPSYKNTNVQVKDLSSGNVQPLCLPVADKVNANGDWMNQAAGALWTSTEGGGQLRTLDFATGRVGQLLTPMGLSPSDAHELQGKVVFATKGESGQADRLWKMNLDGSQAIALTNPPHNGQPGLHGDFDPRWSPDGSKIAFMRINGGVDWEIWIYWLQWSLATCITIGSLIEALPNWSSDSGKLIYRRFDLNEPANNGLWHMSPTGNYRTKIPLPAGYTYGSPSFFPGEGSGPTARFVCSRKPL